MSNILSSMDAAPLPVPKSRKRKPSLEYDNSSSPLSSGSRFSTYRSSKLSSGFTSSDPPDESSFPSSDGVPFSPQKKLKVGDYSGVGMTPAIDKLTKMEVNTPGVSDTSFDDMTFDTDDLYMDVDCDKVSTAPLKKEELIMKTSIPVSAPQRLPLMVKDEERKEDALPSWLSVHAALNVTDDSVGMLDRHRSSSHVSALEEDGSLRFYWIDYLELDGKVYFVGKVLDKQTNKYVSCCVTVENLVRNLYVLPRTRRVGACFSYSVYYPANKIVDHGADTDIIPTQDDVYDDFEQIRRKVGVKSWAAKWVKRKYAFGEEGVPTGEADWMKVVYGFNGW